MESINPTSEDASAPPLVPVVMDPSLLMAVSMGDCEALKILLNWGDAPIRPQPVAPQVVVDVPDGSTINHGTTNGNLDVQHEQGAPSSADPLLEGVTPVGDTALHVLAKSGYSSRENFLDCTYVVYNKARHLLDKPNKMGDTPLHFAARSGRFKMVRCLLELAEDEEGGIDRLKYVLRKQNMRGETALHEAIRVRNRDIVVLLLKRDSQLARVPSEGMSPLYLAVMLQQCDVAIMLHENDNQLSYSGPDGQNVLHVSVSILVDIEFSKLLMNWNKELAKKQCDNGSTPLHLSVYRSDIMVPIVLEANLSAAYQPNESGSFPIHTAALRGRLKVVITFLESCPECLNLCDSMGRTFLHVAVDNKSYDIVSYACGAPSVASILNAQDNDGNTALHLAVQAKDLRMVCSLFREQQVQLSLPNNSGRTPLDLAWFSIPDGLFYSGNPQVIIHRSLRFANARYGCYGVSLLNERPKFKQDEDSECEMIKDSTQTLGIGSVLIATVAFGATFALPGGYRADDHPNGGTPTLAGRYVFDAFIMATTLAFVCASAATTSLMLSGMAMVDLALRRKHLNLSVCFAQSSVTSLGASFALGLYMVLAPVAASTAIAVLVVTFVVMVVGMSQPLQTLMIVRALHIRLGKTVWRIVVQRVVMLIGFAFWPFILIFGWPVFSTNYRHH